ncbi:MAG: glutamate synthase [Sulfolobaceae archaeon]|nr:glutamate synthase [Sulfolobaceae archaeon]
MIEGEYYPSGCGIFGILRKRNASKIKGKDVVRAIERVRFRGSDRGAGFAVFNFKSQNYYLLKIFYRGSEDEVRELLEKEGINVIDVIKEAEINDICSCSVIALADLNLIKMKMRTLNFRLWKDKIGRIYSAGSSLQVYKGVGYPLDIARIYNIDEIEGDMWLAHTRQPTNSPGYYPYWSHPFSSFNVAVVHNGDISSFGANMEFLKSKGIESFVGTDSEVIAFLFEELVNEGFSLEETIEILINPSRRIRPLDPFVEHMLRNARLDGPFSVIIGYDSGDDLYLIGIADRNKFRPMIMGEDENYYYIASEENEIRELSPNARVWTLKPGEYFLASLNKGVIRYGRPLEEIDMFSPPPIFRPKEYDIDAHNIDYRELNYYILKEIEKGKRLVRVANVLGHRYIGINLPSKNIRGVRIELYGVAGNCLANLNDGNEFYVYGNVGDDCCDTMHEGKVVILGDARDVLAQTFQSGKIFVKGNAGNRVGIQMRQYKDRKPYLIIGGRVDNYLGEYMAGGIIVVFGRGSKSEPVGYFIGTGMIGGKILIRGKVSPNKIGLQPPKIEILNLLRALVIDNIISPEEYEQLKDKEYIELVKSLEGRGREYLRKLIEDKLGIPTYEYRELNEEEFKELEPVIKEFSADVGEDFNEFLKEKFTVVFPPKFLKI